MNTMLDAIENSDQVVTVSKTFAREMQSPSLGFGIDSWMRKAAHEGKLSGIVNGSNPDIWNPSTNSTLKNWVDPVTKERIDLSFSSKDLDIIEKKSRIKEQLQKAIQVYYPGAAERFGLDFATKDYLLYVGRYDSTQRDRKVSLIFGRQQAA
jgi:glycogen synthase